MSDIAHLGPVEMFTPRPEASLEFFVEVMGMEVAHEQGPSTYLRGWGDYQPRR
jgi:catechol 2,3-dioxygenase